ncbi:MAG: hypothetical protein WBG44_12855 [Comamonas sp.]
MPASPVDTVAIYRASIVGAVKRSSVLMSDLVRLVRAQWQQHETPGQASAQEAQALQHLVKHESRLVAQYPLAMLELFAQGVPAQPGGLSATGKLLEIGKDDARLRVEMVRARQRIAHEVAPALSELDTLIGAAQGFDRVQPERNPLRPGNYVRALFGVVYGVGVPTELVRLWLAPMQSGLGTLLAREYRRVSEDLRARGVQPLHYVTTGRSRFSGLVADEPFAHSRTDAMESFLAPMGQEALPGIDSSMWDSLRAPAPLTVAEALDAVTDDFPQTAHGLEQDGTASAQMPLGGGHELPVPQHQEAQGAQAAAPPIHEATEAPAAAASAPGPAVGGASLETSLSVGEWVDIAGAHGVVRTQLTWLSPRNTLFLFTQADGSTQSMTSRMVARLLRSGAMKRMVS